ncbi:hypothetical protein L226DRAFT_525084 [Lentinus tigrinus ALCF2SS1-7]|uniref:uncharacterized protein n=1 Tax=Lentinus tigrinus ALCF2SS1-7 TaxID=1328758 RepID=UPI001165DDB9|nr:hypothetical protein L226DRAFT_525084 [Lentinus tigrinus ALCF2SS1-7]
MATMLECASCADGLSDPSVSLVLFACIVCADWLPAAIVTRLFPSIVERSDLSGPPNDTGVAAPADDSSKLQDWLNRALETLQLIRGRRLTSTALEDLDARLQHHRQALTCRVEDYFPVRQRIAYLQEQSVVLARQLIDDRQAVKDAKRQLSKETSAVEKARRIYVKEENELRVAIAKAHQRIQRRIRHERRGAMTMRRRPNRSYIWYGDKEDSTKIHEYFVVSISVPLIPRRLIMTAHDHAQGCARYKCPTTTTERLWKVVTKLLQAHHYRVDLGYDMTDIKDTTKSTGSDYLFMSWSSDTRRAAPAGEACALLEPCEGVYIAVFAAEVWPDEGTTSSVRLLRGRNGSRRSNQGIGEPLRWMLDRVKLHARDRSCFKASDNLSGSPMATGVVVVCDCRIVLQACGDSGTVLYGTRGHMRGRSVGAGRLCRWYGYRRERSRKRAICMPEAGRGATEASTVGGLHLRSGLESRPRRERLVVDNQQGLNLAGRPVTDTRSGLSDSIRRSKRSTFCLSGSISYSHVKVVPCINSVRKGKKGTDMMRGGSNVVPKLFLKACQIAWPNTRGHGSGGGRVVPPAAQSHDQYITQHQTNFPRARASRRWASSLSVAGIRAAVVTAPLGTRFGLLLVTITHVLSTTWPVTALRGRIRVAQFPAASRRSPLQVRGLSDLSVTSVLSAQSVQLRSSGVNETALQSR